MEDFSNLPVELQELTPFLNEWSIPDDVEREKKVENMTQIDKDELINIVSPKFQAINNYLDSFNDKAMPEEAILVGDLAQLVCELMI